MKPLFLFTLLIVIISCSNAQNFETDTNESPEAFANRVVEEFAKEYPGMSISISQNGSIVWNKTVGYRDLNQELPVTRDTRFNIYSTSKPITGLAYLKLVHTGVIKDLDQKIRTIDPSLPAHYDAITLRHLLAHTSGIRHYEGRKDWQTFSDMRCAGPSEALKHFINDPLKAVPGEKYIYTTFGMTLASHLLEKITGLDYIAALNSLLPFSNELHLDSEQVDKATPYIRKGKKYKVYEGLSAECKYGGGGLVASSDQLVEAGQIFYDGSLLPLDDLKALLKSNWKEGKNNGVGFAIGAGIAEKELGPNPVLYVAAGGASPGGRSYLLILADLKIAVAITTNCEGDGQRAYELAMAIAKKYVGI